MDDIGEFLRASTLDGFPVKTHDVSSSQSFPASLAITAGNPSPSSTDSPASVSTTLSSTTSSPRTFQPHSVYSSALLGSSLMMSGGNFASPSYAVLSPAISQDPVLSWVQSDSTPSTEGYPSSFFLESSELPEMPTFQDARDDEFYGDGGEEEGETVQGGKGGKIQKGRQRSSGPLSAHAVYARMNRERKKKYITDLERYRATMHKNRIERQRELDQIQRESVMLSGEIAGLRNELLSNQTLMSLLNMGRHNQ